jgi:peptidoglycan L-alanyl-D-glutamate endopeptidase CwlK
VNLTSRDRARLKGVHPDLVRVIERAANHPDCPDFIVLEGIRTVARQRTLVAEGASKTMNSRHIPAKNGYGHAVDIAPMIGGKVSWDWPLYHKLAPFVKRAAKQEGVPIEWGGNWRDFKDGPHWQLPWKQYPGNTDPRVASADRYTSVTDSQDDNRRLAIAGAGVTTGAGIGADPAATALDAITQQQGEISSGDIARLIVAVAVVAFTVWLAVRRKPQ